MNFISNAKWNSLSQIFKIVAQVTNIVYLARIIPPADYGLMAMALVVINLGMLLRDLGTSSVIIQKKELSIDLINTVFWINTFAGFLIALMIIALSPLVSFFYDEKNLTLILIYLSIIFPLSSTAAAHLALLERESRFKKISIIEISSSIIALLVAILLANLGFGILSLVFQSIIMSGMSAVQFWMASTWRPRFRKMISITELKSILGFSGNLALFNFVNYFSRNADSFIVGKFMSASILGCYNLAYRIMLFPLQSITFVASRSLYPVLSRNQDDEKLIGDMYLKVTFIIIMITCPLMSGLAFFSTPFVHIVFGSQWSLTADILKWLAPTAIIQSILSTTGAVFMARNRTYLMMKLGLIGAVLQVSAFIIGVKFSIVVFAMFYMIANILNFFPTMFFLLHTINVTWGRFILNILPVLYSTIVMLFFLFFITSCSKGEGEMKLLSLFSYSMLGGGIYLLSMIIFSNRLRDMVMRIFKNV
ncbi:lipopolysaccharide biosynthesis protein [Klebsiella pneumoniae]|uniref:lipopolysaccharide biosynthesis protein n=1 Tax=Klebsiella pneumoniae complex TaxID=3390273 RepID=UPI0007CA2F2B|nr:lipopolysaccharide biosynthesis protein [Klebsiella pneumoniae]SAR60101.1 polysaccharide biosynthesis protein [Klebsiella pneumoniae]